jgi:hypothetical protein
LLRRNLNFEKRLTVYLAQTYIAASFNQETNYLKLYNRGIRYMRRLDKSFSENASWDEARVAVARLRMEV